MTKEVIQSLIRHVLTAFGAILVSKGVVGQTETESIVGGVVTAVGLGLSVWDKYKHRV